MSCWKLLNTYFMKQDSSFIYIAMIYWLSSSKGFLSKLAKVIKQLMQPIVSLLKYWVMLSVLNLLFHLLISSIARINPFSGCSHYLEVNQVIYDGNRLTGFSVMGISVERNFRAICKIIFLVNRILLLLPVSRLTWIFFIYMVYLIFLTLYCFSTLVCANLVGKGFGRFVCFDLRSRFNDVVSWSVQLFLTILLLTGKTYFQRCQLIWCSIGILSSI